MPPQIGKTTDEIVLRQVGQYCSNAMSTAHLVIFLDVAKTTSDVALKFLRPWRRYISDPSVFSVLPQTFKTIASTQANYQWVRLALLAWAYGADRENTSEVKHVLSKIISTAVKTAHVEQIRKFDKSLLVKVDELLGKVIGAYWIEPMTLEIGRGDLRLLNVGHFMRKSAKFLTSSKATTEPQTVLGFLAKFETTMRTNLEGAIALPQRIFELQELEEKDRTQKPPVAASETASSKAALKFRSDGTLVQNTAAKLDQCGLFIGARVEFKKLHGEVPQGTEADIIDVDSKGVQVKVLTKPSISMRVPASLLKIVDRAAKIKEEKAALAEAQEKQKADFKALPDGIGYRLASDEQSSSMMLMWATCGLYKLHVGSGPGPSEIRLVPEPRQVYAVVDLKPEALCIVPFSSDVSADVPGPDVTHVAFSVEMEDNGKVLETRKFYAKMFEPHGAAPDADPPVMPAIAVYWWLRTVAPQESSTRLKCSQIKVPVTLHDDCPPPLKKQRRGLKINLLLPIWTNGTDVRAGQSLCL